MDYTKYFGDIEKEQYKHFFPSNSTELNLNRENQRIEFLIDVGDNFVASKFQYFISGEFNAKDGEHFGANSGVKLIDNFVPYLFNKIEVKKHNKMIDYIDHPGILSTVKGSLTFSKEEASVKSNGGFEYHVRYGKFFVTGNLSDLGLGYFEDVKLPIYKGGFLLTFLRASDNDAVFRGVQLDGKSVAPEGKITIKDFYIRVPIVEFNPTTKIELVNELTKFGSQPFNFRKWECIEKRGVTGTTFSFDITNIYRNVDKPKFVVALFQTSRTNDQLKDPSKFDHANVRNIRVKINDTFYPEELLNLDPSEGNYVLMYDMYQDFKRTYGSTSSVYYNPSDFINNRPMYVFNVTKGPNNISQSRNNVIVNFDFNTPPQPNTTLYIIIVSMQSLVYDVIRNNVEEV